MLQDRVTKHISEPGRVAGTHEDTQLLASRPLTGNGFFQNCSFNPNARPPWLQEWISQPQCSLPFYRYAEICHVICNQFKLQAQVEIQQRFGIAAVVGRLDGFVDWQRSPYSTLSEQKMEIPQARFLLLGQPPQNVHLGGVAIVFGYRVKTSLEKGTVTFPPQPPLTTSRSSSTSSARQDASKIFKARGLLGRVGVTFPPQLPLTTSRVSSTSSARQDASNIFKACGWLQQRQRLPLSFQGPDLKAKIDLGDTTTPYQFCSQLCSCYRDRIEHQTTGDFKYIQQHCSSRVPGPRRALAFNMPIYPGS